MDNMTFATTHPSIRFDIYVTLDADSSRILSITDCSGNDVETTPQEEASLRKEALEYMDGNSVRD